MSQMAGSHLFNNMTPSDLYSWLPTDCDWWNSGQELGQWLWCSVSHKEYCTWNSVYTVVSLTSGTLHHWWISTIQVYVLTCLLCLDYISEWVSHLLTTLQHNNYIICLVPGGVVVSVLNSWSRVPGTGESVINKADPPGWGPSIALRLGSSLRLPQMWVSRVHNRLLAIASSGNDSGQVVHTQCASVTKQYNLVPARWRWCSLAGKVTAGLAESNGCLPLPFVPYV